MPTEGRPKKLKLRQQHSMTDNYTIRRANADDVDSIYNLTSSNADKGLMLPRSKYKIVIHEDVLESIAE